MKKGYICQKDNLIKNLPYLYYKNYPNNCTFIFSENVSANFPILSLNNI